MQALIEFIAGFVAMLAAAALFTTTSVAAQTPAPPPVSPAVSATPP